jgi:hypothetical protein
MPLPPTLPRQAEAEEAKQLVPEVKQVAPEVRLVMEGRRGTTTIVAGGRNIPLGDRSRSSSPSANTQRSSPTSAHGSPGAHDSRPTSQHAVSPSAGGSPTASSRVSSSESACSTPKVYIDSKGNERDDVAWRFA